MGIHGGPVNSPHKWPVTRKMFPFDDVIMIYIINCIRPPRPRVVSWLQTKTCCMNNAAFIKTTKQNHKTKQNKQTQKTDAKNLIEKLITCGETWPVHRQELLTTSVITGAYRCPNELERLALTQAQRSGPNMYIFMVSNFMRQWQSIDLDMVRYIQLHNCKNMSIWTMVTNSC